MSNQASVFRVQYRLSEKQFNKYTEIWNACWLIMASGHGSRGEVVENEAIRLGMTAQNLYIYLARFCKSKKFEDLSPKITRKPIKRTKRAKSNSLELLAKVIFDRYLTRDLRRVKQCYDEYTALCQKQNLIAVSLSTMHRIIKQIPEATIAQKRDEPALRNRHYRVNYDVPQVAFAPWEMVQIDHKQLDFECVDDETRLPCGRLWLTLVVDCFTGAVVGFYLSFDAPSSIAIARALLHCATPKQQYLDDLGIRGSWPMNGVPGCAYTDNGPDFASMAIAQGFARLGKDPPMFRPKGQPNYGGLIERAVGLAGEQFNGGPGDTGSSIARKGARDPSKTAALTIGAVEKFLTNYFVNIYNPERFSKTSSPLYKWHQAEVQNTFQQISLTDDELRSLYISFLPTAKRTVKQYGIRIKNLEYRSDYLNSLMQNGNHSHIFHFDDKDARFVYHYDDESKIYTQIPSSISHLPPMSSSTFNAKLKKTRAESDAFRDPNALAWALEFNKELIKDEVDLTKSKKARAAKEKSKRTQRPKVLEPKAADQFDPMEEDFVIKMDEPERIYDYV
jgi:putative transposase